MGVVAIIGRPNVGKSTFLNTALAFHLVAVSPKPQTTRGRWRGILSDADSQIIFVDTPGAHEDSHRTRLNVCMLEEVDHALHDADVMLAMFDGSRPHGAEDTLVLERLRQHARRVLVVINKQDIAPYDLVAQMRAHVLAALGAETPILVLTAKSPEQVQPVLAQLRTMLPEGPFFYPPEQVTDAFERDIAAEMIREAALALLADEVPHALAVEIMTWREGPPKVRIDANLCVERESQVGIVVGAAGARLAAIRKAAIPALRELVELPVDLRLHVKVEPDWRNRKDCLRAFGMPGGRE